MNFGPQEVPKLENLHFHFCLNKVINYDYYQKKIKHFLSKMAFHKIDFSLYLKNVLLPK